MRLILYIETEKETFEHVYLFLLAVRHFEILDCKNNFSFSQNSSFVQQFSCSNENI